MNLKCKMILQEYKDNLETYNVIADLVKKKLEDAVKELGMLINSVETRVKTEKSLTGKLELKGDKYQSITDITDIVGARVVTFYADEVDKIAVIVEKTFDIDWDNSIDKRRIYNVDQFGYMSLHYICSIPETMYKDEKYPLLNTVKFEIQLRSTLQHVWASITHDTGYKSDVEVPKKYLRELNRLAGLLEIADDNFIQIRNSLGEYRRRIKQIVKDGDFSDVELTIDSYEAYLENGGFRFLNERIASINNMEIEEISHRSYLKVFKKLGFKTLKDLDDFVTNYSDLAYDFSVRQFSGKDIDIITSDAGPLALMVVFLLSNDMGENIIKQCLDSIYGPRKTNVKQAHRLTLIGKSMGLVKEEEEE